MNTLENNLKSKYIIADGYERSYEFRVAEKIKASEKLRCEINLSNNIIEILDKSLLCISLLTDDNVFYDSNREKIKILITRKFI